MLVTYASEGIRISIKGVSNKPIHMKFALLQSQGRSQWGGRGGRLPPGHQKSGRRAKIGKGKKGERKEKRGKGREERKGKEEEREREKEREKEKGEEKEKKERKGKEKRRKRKREEKGRGKGGRKGFFA